TWDSPAGGVFNNAQNWIDQNGHHGVPGAADTAIIKGSGFTVSINQATCVGNLISNARIAINCGTLTLDSPCQRSAIAPLVLNPQPPLAVDTPSLNLPGDSPLAGKMNAAPGTSIDFTGGRQDVEAGAAFAGTGTYVINNGPCGLWVVHDCITAPSNL